MSTALGLTLLGTPLYISPYGRATTAYRSAIGANGSSIISARLQNIDQLLYGQYSDGAGGTGCIDDFREVFEGANAGLFTFYGDDLNASLVPLLGNGGDVLVNTGFVEGDYSASSGIQGDNSSYLATGILADNLSFDDFNFTVSAVLVNDGLNSHLIRSGSGSYLRLYKPTGNNLISAVADATTGGIYNAPISSLSGTFSIQSVAADDMRLYEGLTQVGIRTVARSQWSAPGDVLDIFAPAQAGDQLIRFASVSPALTTSQRNILHNAITDFIANR